MKFRIARHTTNLEPMIKFYTGILGLEVLGSFENHEGYSGVFLGLKNESWHLEFTVSEDKPFHNPDEDDLLVFYIKSKDEYLQILERFESEGIKRLSPKNPYWEKSSATFEDPDGYRVVINFSADAE